MHPLIPCTALVVNAFWSGTGSAIVGSLLSGVVALVAALWAANRAADKARKHDWERDARQAAGRFNLVVHDAIDTAVFYGADSYTARARKAVSDIGRAHLIELPHIGQVQLFEQCEEIINWLRDVWVPAIDVASKDLPKPQFNPRTGATEVQDARPLRVVAEAGLAALSNLASMLTMWQLNGELLPVDLPDLPAAAEVAQDAVSQG